MLSTTINPLMFSIVIPAFNEEHFLPMTIAAVNECALPEIDFEIIVVNNGSTDQTSEVARRYGVLLLEIDRSFVGVARNVGARSARGEVLVFLDADCVPSIDWLSNGLKSFQAESCVTGAFVDVPNDACWIERAWCSQRKGGRCEVSYINSGNLFISRALFSELGGFNETLSSGEDYDLCSRAKTHVKIIADDSIKVVHLGNPKTIKAFMDREIWHGIGAISALKFSWFDKPFLCTIFFGIFSLFQLLGLILVYTNYSKSFVVVGTLGVILVLVLTVIYRIYTKAPLKYSWALLVLYYFYYLARLISLFKVLLGQSNYQRSRVEN